MIPPWVPAELDALEAAQARRRLRTVASPAGPRVRVDGRELRCFSSNDYLGLAADPRLAEAAARAARRWGTGAGASRLITGTLGIHEALEHALARLKGTQTALLFPSGYQANLGVVTALGAEGAIFSDALNHASLVDGCRLARATTRVFRHGDPAHLAAQLEAHGDVSRKLVVTDGVFSMDGDLAPLPELLDTAAAHGAAVVVDDAHATGVVGDGRGTTHHYGLPSGRVVHVGTLGKALGAVGAFVACAAPVRDLLVNRARTLVYTTAPAPPAVGAALEAVRILEREPERVARLAANSRRLRAGLRAVGFPVPEDPTPIVPLVLGDNRTTLAWAEALWRDGFWVHPIRPPTVPPGSGRLRITVSSEHAPGDIDALVERLGEYAEKPRSREARKLGA
ncbi:MAG: 8-amino-7-oxononanoate synthase [Deferrisomatales bacterium]